MTRQRQGRRPPVAFDLDPDLELDPDLDLDLDPDLELVPLDAARC